MAVNVYVLKNNHQSQFLHQSPAEQDNQESSEEGTIEYTLSGVQYVEYYE